MNAADLVAIVMARKLADFGFEVRLYLAGAEWTVLALKDHGPHRTQTAFAFRVSSANMLRDPEGYAELHARQMRDELQGTLPQ